VSPARAIDGSRPRPDWPSHLVIWVFLLIELFPLYMMLQVSFKDNASFIDNPWLPTAPATWIWANWSFGLRLISPYIMNTVFVATTGTIGTIAFAISGAYFFARCKMPFGDALWAAFLLLMLLPGVTNIVPLFTQLKDLDLLNTLWALVIVGIASAQVFNIFVLRHFIEDLPKDLFEAAEMDGAGHLQRIWHIVIPLSAPIIGTLFILAFLGKWNEILLPIIVLRDKELFTLGVGLFYLDGEYTKQWGQVMAAYFVSAIPLIIVFLFAMRFFVKGLSSGAIKG